ncbi:MAG: polysaccharide biosynthesis C-terminal domain-containing protein [Lachnospiraceae bacterium]|nr:polysaccharide biosynthesis C-terminal domain-containing protein [Lachnospiraceae bacterium]
MSRVKKALKNEYFFSVISKVVLVFVGVAISSLKVRFFGKEMAGRLLYMTSTSQMLSHFFKMGYNQSYAFLKKNRGDDFKERYLGSALLMTLIYTAGCLFFILLFKPDPENTAIAAFVPMVFLQTALGGMTMVERPQVRNIVHMSGDSILLLILCICYFFITPSFVLILFVFVFVDVIRFLSYITVLKPKVCFDRETLKLFKWLFVFGIVPMLGAFLLNVNYKVDVWMLKRMLDYELVAVYSVGVLVADQCWAISTSLSEILLSKLAGGKSGREVCRILRYSNTVTLLIQIGFVLIGRIAIRIVYGGGYDESYAVLCLVMLGSYGMNYTKMIGTYCVVEGKQVERTLILAITAAANVGLNLYLIPIMGIMGAAVASVISYNLCGILMISGFRKWSGNKVGDMLVVKRSDIKDLKGLLRKEGKG